MSEDKLLTRRQILGIFGSTTGAAIVGTSQADLGTNEQGNLYGGTANMAGAYQVGPGLWKGPRSVRGEVPAEDGNDFIQTDAGDDGNLYAMHHYNGGWDEQGVKVTSLEAEELLSIVQISASDTIQSKIDEYGGNTLYVIHEGLYQEEPDLSGLSNVELRGVGEQTHIENTNTDGTHCITATNDSGSGQENITIRNLRVTGQGVDSSGNAIHFSRVDSWTVDGCWLEDSGTGVDGAGVYHEHCADGKLMNTKTHTCRNGYLTPQLGQGHCRRTQIGPNNRFINSADDAVHTQREVESMVFNNDCRDSGDDSIDLWGCNAVDVFNNRCKPAGTADGLEVGDGSSNCTLKGNTVIGGGIGLHMVGQGPNDNNTSENNTFRDQNGDAAMFIGRSVSESNNHFTSVGDVIQNPSGVGIKLYAGYGHTVKDATVTDAGDHAIRVDPSPDGETKDTDIENCTVRRTTGGHNLLIITTENVTVKGGTYQDALDSDRDGIYVQNSDDVSIIGVRARGNARSGVGIRSDSTGCAVLSCDLRGNSGSNIGDDASDTVKNANAT